MAELPAPIDRYSHPKFDSKCVKNLPPKDMVVFRNFREGFLFPELHCRSTVPTINRWINWWFPGRQPQRPAATKKTQVIQRFGKRLKWRRQINVEEAKLTDSSLALTDEFFPIRVAGVEGLTPPSQWVGAFFWHFFFMGIFNPKRTTWRISTSEFQILEFSSAGVEGAGFVGLTLSARKRNNDGWIRATNKKVRQGGVSEGISRSLILVVLLEKLISKKITTHAIPLANYAGNPIIACW